MADVMNDLYNIKTKHSYEKIRGIKKVTEDDIDWLIKAVEEQHETIINQQRSLFLSDEKIEELHKEIALLKEQTP